MKKSLATVVALVLSAVMLFALCACGSTWGAIKSAYEKEGYYEITLSDKAKEALNISDEDIKEADATVHFLCTVKLSEDPTVSELLELVNPKTKTAIVWEYKNIEAVQKAYKEDLSESEQEKFDELWAEYQKSDHVNGNCILIVGDTKPFTSSK